MPAIFSTVNQQVYAVYHISIYIYPYFRQGHLIKFDGPESGQYLELPVFMHDNHNNKYYI